MTWLVYPSLSEAEAAEALIWDAIKPPFEVRGGEPQKVRVTQRWADPVECKEGWAIPAPEQAIKGVGGAEMARPTFPAQEMP